nr:site-2 protease family protein [Leptospira ryugenii]
MPLKKQYFLHIFLFLFTFLSLTYREYLFIGILSLDWNLLASVFWIEWPYSVSLLLVLLAHEMGHYVMARIHRVEASLPYFIPFPLGPIGTMGAVIQIRERIPNKRALFDIGIGGPIASLILSMILWIIGISLSELVPLNQQSNLESVTFFGESAFTYLSNQFYFGGFDSSQMDVNIHPFARAAWVGLLITAINLLPFGQLDGGHIIYSIFGESYRKWIYWLYIAFLFLALVNFTWLIWGFIIFYFIKIEHPYIPDHKDGIGNIRKFLGLGILLSLLIIFVPKPIMIGSQLNQPSLLEYIWNQIQFF